MRSIGSLRIARKEALCGICSTPVVPSLWNQLFSLHMGVEGIFVTAIDSFSIFKRLVAICVSGATRKEYRTADGNFQEMCLLASRQTCLQLLLSLYRR